MPTTVVVGGQWGDEGKAKMVDYYAKDMDMVVRYQGGANAGHTVIAEGKKYVFHLIPSGILYPETVCVIGNGVVFEPEAFFAEVEMLRSHNIDFAKRIFISSRAHVIMPYHKAIDGLAEKSSGDRIGTTKRGIGPAYTDKMSRVGIRVADLLSRKTLRAKIEAALPEKNAILAFYGEKPMTVEPIVDAYTTFGEKLAPYIEDVVYRVNDMVRAKKNVLFEGAQGAGLDIDFGTYPFVTSSNPTSAGACTGSGVGPNAIDRIVGVCKAYVTRVGGGPLPTRLIGAEEENLRKIGGEYGATTGRPRGCGWFDGVQMKFSSMINGFTDIALTKMDIFNTFESIQVCTGYRIDGKVTDTFPADSDELFRAEPVYETLEGWKSDICAVRTFGELPRKAKEYIRFLESLVGVRVSVISVGADREAMVVR
ncbi:MAG: adenylosuccinate synthase [Spirochaetota bacterium]